ncbi:LLM class flavin-dependent oxidoreductase [Brevibacterium samyangense]|uniref:LLM class flavin-dependent oxidoreductase n=1 Tax=Brevibacterium samyangense TaxID=366888 RepID=A0ABN2TKI7_9MICO
MKLSVLDLVSVRRGQTTGQALRASKSLVDTADRLGFTRYWVAEHHNMPSVASTEPGVELMYLGRDTQRIRLGSGGVMLPNHAPLAIAEQFALLSAVYGDRIDLGIGRAPGTDPITSAAMRGHLGDAHLVDRSGVRIDPVENFPQHVMDVLALLTPEGARVPLMNDREHVLHATPASEHAAQVWLLGSSGYSAQLAAMLGLPYVFAHHFAGTGTESALNLYRNSFEPTEHSARHGGTSLAESRTFLTMNAVVAPTEEEARLLAEPHIHSMAGLRIGRTPEPMRLVGEDVRSVMTDGDRHLGEAMTKSWIIGDPQQAADRAREAAERFGVDEIMIHPVAGAYPEDPLTEIPMRVRTLELLAAELL